MTTFSIDTDSYFAPEEHLYIRLNPQYFPKEFVSLNEVPLNEVKFPDFSVNRGEYSYPEDVLKPHWPQYGIAGFLTRDIPGPITFETNVFTFKPQHLPDVENGNFAHAEIWTYKNGTRDFNPKNPLPKTVKTTFRATLRDRMVLLRLPSP